MNNPWNAACAECPAAQRCFEQFVAAAGQEAGDASLMASAEDSLKHVQLSLEHLKISDEVTGIPGNGASVLRSAGVTPPTEKDRSRAVNNLTDAILSSSESSQKRASKEAVYTKVTGSCDGPIVKRLGSYTIIRCKSENKSVAPVHTRIKIRKTTFADRYIDVYGDPLAPADEK